MSTLSFSLGADRSLLFQLGLLASLGITGPACVDLSTPTTCFETVDCPSSQSCIDGVCQESCADGACADSVCGNGIVEAGESCDGGDGEWPLCCEPATCGLKGADTMCRDATSECDVAETCSGSSSVCPPDGLADEGESCAAGECRLGGCVAAGSSPFGGTPWPVPGRIEAENYNEGGENVAYHDSTAGNRFGEYRAVDVDVDVQVATDSGGSEFNVGSIDEAGEWLEYTIDVGAADNYDIAVRVATEFDDRALHIEIDGEDVTGPLGVPNTGGWQTWSEVTAYEVPMEAGVHVARLAADTAHFNINWFEFSVSNGAPRNDPELVITGTILREYWTGISGNSVTDLTSHPNYPDTPSGSEELATLEGPTNFAEAYGTRIRGYVHPPTTGDYTFWIASDDESALLLSTSSDPAGASTIATLNHWVNPRAWDADPSQESSPVSLVGGQAYYIEALHKDGNGGDHVSVAWQGPGISRSIIDGAYLSPWNETVHNDPDVDCPAIMDLDSTLLAANLTPSGPIGIYSESDVVINGMHVSNPNGDCILVAYGASNITIRDSIIGPCGGKGIYVHSDSHHVTITGNYMYDIHEDAVMSYQSHDITVDSNMIERVQRGYGMWTTSVGNLKFTSNFVKNILGHDDGNYQPGQVSGFGNMVMAAFVHAPGIRINDNVNINVRAESQTEDLVNTYECDGEPGDPIQVNNNIFYGSGPDHVSGGGILLGDVWGTYQEARNNIIVNPGSYGLAMVAGHHLVFADNKVYSDDQQPYTNVGVMIGWGTGNDAVEFSNNEITYWQGTHWVAEPYLYPYWREQGWYQSGLEIIGWDTNKFDTDGNQPANLDETIAPECVLNYN